MKNYFYSIKSAAFVSLLFICTILACKDDDNTEPVVVVDTNPIVGTWQLTSITPETAGATIPAIAFAEAAVPCIYQLKVNFKDNNTITTADCDAAVTAIGPFVPVGTDATWKVNGDSLTLSRSGVSQKFKITQNTTDLNILVNTQTDATKPKANAFLNFKRK